MKMLQYTVKRFVIMLFTLFIIATATFFLLAATPGDALSARVEKLPDSVAARMYAKYGPGQARDGALRHHHERPCPR